MREKTSYNIDIKHTGSCTFMFFPQTFRERGKKEEKKNWLLNVFSSFDAPFLGLTDHVYKVKWMDLVLGVSFAELNQALLAFEKNWNMQACLAEFMRKACLFFIHWRNCLKIVHLCENISPGTLPRATRTWIISLVNVRINPACQALTCSAQIL